MDAPISAIASIPAMAVSSDVTVSAAYLHMVEHGIHHLVVTDTSGSAVGIARVVDIAATDVRHPLLIRSATASANSFDELARAATMLRPTAVELWDAGVPPFHLGALYSTMVEAVFRKIIDLSTSTAPLAGIHSSWMLLGSLGRREPLLNSDIDTALVWNPTAVDGSTQPSREDIATACRPLLDRLDQFGLMPCPEGSTPPPPCSTVPSVRGNKRPHSGGPSSTTPNTLCSPQPCSTRAQSPIPHWRNRYAQHFRPEPKTPVSAAPSRTTPWGVDRPPVSPATSSSADSANSKATSI